MLLPYYLSHRNCVKIIQNYTTFVINTVTNTTYPVAINLRDDRILCNTTVKTIFVKTFYCLVDKGVIFVVDTGMILPYYVRLKEWFQGFFNKNHLPLSGYYVITHAWTNYSLI